MSAVPQKYDLTTGGIVGRLLLVALPIMGTQLMQMTYNLTDMFWLGRVSSDVVAASGTAGMYMWLSNGFLFVGRMGAEIGVSQYLGRGDAKSARSFSQNALFLAVVLGVLFASVALVFRRPLIGFFQIQETHVAEAAVSYLSITAMAIPMTFITGAIAGTFNASGNSRTPFAINAMGLVINMILDPLLIFGLDMQIVGAAIATAIAQTFVCLLAVIAIRWSRTSPLDTYSFRFRPEVAKMKQIVKWSLPISIESTLFTCLSMLISRLVATFGADAMAAQRVGTQVESLSWLISGGFSSAVTAFVGQNYGAGKWGRIRKGVGISVAAMAIWGSIVTLILFFAGGVLFSVFLPDPELVVIGKKLLKILALCQVMGTLESVGAGAFRGVGKTLPPSVASVTTNAFRVLLCYWLASTSLGLDGIWWGFSIGATLRGAWIFLWYMWTLHHQPREDALAEPQG